MKKSLMTFVLVAVSVASFAQSKFNVTGTTGFASAQVTAGGLDTTQFDDETMMSKANKGFYAIGEILDIDGDCGGFNLQWAWSSGRLCGESVITGDIK